MKIVADEHIPYVSEHFAQGNELVLRPGREISADEVKNAEVLLVRAVTKVDASLLKDSSMRFVGSVTSGLDHVDTAWLKQQGIAYASAAGFNAQAVADYVVSVAAVLQRRQMLSAKQARAVVIGVGEVGKRVARHLQTLEMEVLLCDPLRAQAEPDFQHVPLEYIKDVDLICLHVPLTKAGEHASWHMIDGDFLKRQKQGCVLLNASRGAVVDTAALVADGAHLHWCLDVYENEPNIDVSLIERATIATPHIAGYSVQSKQRGVDMIYRECCKRQLVSAAAQPMRDLPRQKLTFAGSMLHWQDVIIGIFNPLLMTTLMRAQLASRQDVGHTYDLLRHQFNYRNEFAYTDVECQDLLTEDRIMLERLGVRISS